MSWGDSGEVSPCSAPFGDLGQPKEALCQHCGPSERVTLGPQILALALWIVIANPLPQSTSCEYQNVSNHCELSLGVCSPTPGVSPLKGVKIRYHARQVPESLEWPGDALITLVADHQD